VDAPAGLVLTSILSAALLAALVPPAHADEPAAAYVVSYIEVAPAASGEARRLLGALRSASRGDDGLLRLDTLHRTERPNHFAIVEAWKSAAARESHTRSAHVREFREKLGRLLSAALDERVHVALAMGATRAAAPGSTPLYVLTHVDVVPTFKDQGADLLRSLAATSRQETGALRFDALTQGNRPNHMTLVEAWESREAFERHIVAGHVQRFRDALAPMSGSLYDERLYAPIE
jgi:quinol monooxygenase YgiN